jgi:hypothetical protein
MNVQDPPCTGPGLPKFRNLFQGPDGINYDDPSGRKGAGDPSHRVNDPASSLECVTEPASLKFATAKAAARSS